MKKIILRDSLGRIQKGNGEKHGLSDHPIYDCWIAMKARCRNKQHPNYHQYGGRGIKVCERWLKFENFLQDMGIPKKGLTLDRIEVNGDYCKENCRWTTIQWQQKNRRNNNQYPGVVFEKDRKKWRADIMRNGKKMFLGRFNNLIEALDTRQRAEANLDYVYG